MPATGDVQVAPFQNCDAMSSLAENIRYGEAADPCKTR